MRETMVPSQDPKQREARQLAYRLAGRCQSWLAGLPADIVSQSPDTFRGLKDDLIELRRILGDMK